MGNRQKHLTEAMTMLEAVGCKISKQSSVYETEAWGKRDQGAFYNEVIEIETELSVKALMQTILKMEKELGRLRKEKWEPRIIDIDILFFNEEIIHEENLSVPHPFLQDRKFVLAPLNEILPDFLHPVLDKTVSQLLSELKDSLEVKRIEKS